MFEFLIGEMSELLEKFHPFSAKLLAIFPPIFVIF